MAASAVEPEAPRLLLGRDFYARDTQTVARDLLGVWLLRSGPDGLAGGPIVEVEAYEGPHDKASHTRAGKTARTAVMFGEVGHAYVYLVYGMHYCLNVVAYSDTEAGAVLIRAVEPRVGVALMRSRRNTADGDARLAAGPARLTQALAIDKSLDGHDLVAGDGVWLSASPEPGQAVEIASGPRIGVDYAGEWADRPWRYWIAGNPSVSRLR